MIFFIKSLLKKTFLFQVARWYRRKKTNVHDVVNFLRPNALIYDIGAHYGDKSLPFLKKGMKILMVEPNPTMIGFLRKYYGKNLKVKIIQNAVGKEIVKKSFFICTEVPGISSLDFNWINNKRFTNFKYDKFITVNQVNLDYLIKFFGNPDYIKIDVENYEYEVILGLTKKSGIISFEFHNENLDKVKKILKRLIKIGYKEFNLSEADNSFFYFEKFRNINLVQDLIITIKKISSKNQEFWGDIYVK